MNLATLSVGAENRTVHYYRKGQGQPLLYLHHMLGMVDFEAALAKLAESFDVIAPYAPGWGPAKDDLTDIDPGPLDLTLHNVDLLNALGVNSVHVVGISIGAWMAAELAAIAPQRVDSLVLVNPLGLWLEKSAAPILSPSIPACRRKCCSPRPACASSSCSTAATRWMRTSRNC
jgi:pimeloyl-ACP methyl ester carboxylesterase